MKDHPAGARHDGNDPVALTQARCPRARVQGTDHDCVALLMAGGAVASLRAADNCDGPLASRLHRINQSVSCTRTVFSTRRSTGLADTGAHVSHATPHLNSYRLSNRLRLWPRR